MWESTSVRAGGKEIQSGRKRAPKRSLSFESEVEHHVSRTGLHGCWGCLAAAMQLYPTGWLAIIPTSGSLCSRIEISRILLVRVTSIISTNQNLDRIFSCLVVELSRQYLAPMGSLRSDSASHSEGVFYDPASRSVSDRKGLSRENGPRSLMMIGCHPAAPKALQESSFVDRSPLQD